jgi:hypothetical protein
MQRIDVFGEWRMANIGSVTTLSEITSVDINGIVTFEHLEFGIQHFMCGCFLESSVNVLHLLVEVRKSQRPKTC